MAKIEAIVVDGVRYDRVVAKTEFICEECDLNEVCCVPNSNLAAECYAITDDKECWKRKEK